MKSPLRILMIVYQFYPVVGGAERQCLKLSETLRGLDVDARVATFRLNRQLPRRERIRAVPVQRLPRLRPAEANMAVLLHCLYRARNTCDVIHIHGANQVAVAAARVARKLWGIPYLIKFTNSGSRFDLALVRREKSWPMRTWIRRAVLAADAVVSTSEAVKGDLLAAGMNPALIEDIPNGVETGEPATESTRRRIRRELGLPEEGCIVLRVGRLSLAKGTVVLLEAWEKVKEHYPAAMLLSVGGRRVPREIQKKIKTLGDSVRFVLDQPDGVLPYLQAADIFVLPSLAEGLSNALLEAQAMGLPSVVTDVGGNGDIISDGVNGVLVPPKSPAELARGIGRLIGSAELREKMRAEASLIAGKFDIQHVARRYIELYTRLIEARGD